MSDNLSKTVHGDFDAVFREVTQSCPVSWITQGELRLFHYNSDCIYILRCLYSFKDIWNVT